MKLKIFEKTYKRKRFSGFDKEIGYKQIVLFKQNVIANF